MGRARIWVAARGLIQRVTQDRYPVKRDARKPLEYMIYFYVVT